MVRKPMFCLTTWQNKLEDMQKVERDLHMELLAPRAISCMQSCIHVTADMPQQLYGKRGLLTCQRPHAHYENAR